MRTAEQKNRTSFPCLAKPREAVRHKIQGVIGIVPPAQKAGGSKGNQPLVALLNTRFRATGWKSTPVTLDLIMQASALV